MLLLGSELTVELGPTVTVLTQYCQEEEQKAAGTVPSEPECQHHRVSDYKRRHRDGLNMQNNGDRCVCNVSPANSSGAHREFV